jgi:hypothetical protein
VSSRVTGGTTSGMVPITSSVMLLHEMAAKSMGKGRISNTARVEECTACRRDELIARELIESSDESFCQSCIIASGFERTSTLPAPVWDEAEFKSGKTG